MGGECQPVPAGPAEAAQRSVLVVEDEVVLRMAVSAHLREPGLVVIEAVDAEEAVELLQRQSGDPAGVQRHHHAGHDGRRPARRLDQRRYPEIRILLTSGITQRGQQPFIAKPYSFLELQRRIEQMLEGRQPM